MIKSRRTTIEKETDIVVASDSKKTQNAPFLPSLPQEQLLSVIGQMAMQNFAMKDTLKPSSNTKYLFEYLKIGAELWNIFTNINPELFTKNICQKAPPFGGIYLIFRGDNLIYVGVSDNIRRRLTEHYNGNSNFAKELIGKYKTKSYKVFVEEHLSVYYKEIDDSTFQRSLEHVVIGVFNPLFNKE